MYNYAVEYYCWNRWNRAERKFIFRRSAERYIGKRVTNTSYIGNWRLVYLKQKRVVYYVQRLIREEEYI